jgi:hypothetical protein
MSIISDFCDNIDMLNLLITEDTDKNILIDEINKISEYNIIIEILNEKNLWNKINPNKVSINFLSKCISKFTKIKIATLIRLFRKFPDIFIDLNWESMINYREQKFASKNKIKNFEIFIGMLANKNFVSWNYIIDKFYISDKFIRKHADKLSMNKLVQKYVLEEQIIIKYGYKINWNKFPGDKISQNIFEKYYLLINCKSQIDYHINDNNIDICIKILKSKNGKFVNVIFYNFEHFEIFVKKCDHIEYKNIMFSNAENYDNLIYYPERDMIIKSMDIKKILKYIKFGEKFMNYLLYHNFYNLFLEIMKKQQISEIFLINNIEYFTEKKIVSDSSEELFYSNKMIDLIENQKLSKNFVDEYILRNFANDFNIINKIIEFQTCLTDELIKKYHIQCLSVALIHHNISYNSKIKMIKIVNINVYSVIKNGYININEEIIDMLNYANYNTYIKILIKFKLSKLNLKYLISKEPLFGHKGIKISKYKWKKFCLRENIKYKDVHSLVIIWYQDEIPDEIFSNINNLMKNLSEKEKFMLGELISKNKNLYINEKNAKLIKTNPRIKSTIFNIKKMYDCRFLYAPQYFIKTPLFPELECKALSM